MKYYYLTHVVQCRWFVVDGQLFQFSTMWSKLKQVCNNIFNPRSIVENCNFSTVQCDKISFRHGKYQVWLCCSFSYTLIKISIFRFYVNNIYSVKFKGQKINCKSNLVESHIMLCEHIFKVKLGLPRSVRIRLPQGYSSQQRLEKGQGETLL